jgi:hypothetical protein
VYKKEYCNREKWNLQGYIVDCFDELIFVKIAPLGHSFGTICKDIL